jgi:thymidylate kinase
MLPIVIDGTGKSIEKVTKQKQELEKLGYDVSLIFVNTNLEVSMDRNRKRERSIDDAETKKLWNQVQKNIGHFNSLFKNDFIVVDNNELLEGKPLEKLKLRLSKVAMKMLNTPLKNHKGKSLIKTLKDNKMKYMSDLVDIEKKLKI